MATTHRLSLLLTFAFVYSVLGIAATAQFAFSGSTPSSPFASDQQRERGDQCFCQLAGKIDDCTCNVDTVDYFNNMKIFPRLMSLLEKPYFRYFQYNAHKPCPFWDINIGKCASSSCGVKSCRPEEIPPGLKGGAGDESEEMKPRLNKYTAEANAQDRCDDDDREGRGKEEAINSRVDDTLSQTAKDDLRKWQDHDDSLSDFCDLDAEVCPDCDHVDLTLNPERYTGYAGEASHRVWRAIYEENCFRPPPPIRSGQKSHKNEAKSKNSATALSATFLPEKLEDMCLEKRAFYRAVSGLHTSITIHLCANYLQKKADTPFGTPADQWGPNLEEFMSRFDPVLTNDQGPYWLRNLYFVYLLELRALTKAAPYLETRSFFTGVDEEDKDTQIAVKELLTLMRGFPDHYDETAMFSHDSATSAALKQEFQQHFRNISRIMDCVGCDKCKLWGKLQVTGLGTALKILFAEGNAANASAGAGASAAAGAGAAKRDMDAWGRDLQRLQPPPPPPHVPDLRLTRNEIVALLNAFGRISTSIRQVEKFRQMLR